MTSTTKTHYTTINYIVKSRAVRHITTDGYIITDRAYRVVTKVGKREVAVYRTGYLDDAIQEAIALEYERVGWGRDDVTEAEVIHAVTHAGA